MPSLTSSAILQVLVLDINDNPPEFERTTYMVSVPESLSEGSKVLQVYATSRDTGVNAEMTYSIIGGNELGHFTVDPDTGKLGRWALCVCHCDLHLS